MNTPIVWGVTASIALQLALTIFGWIRIPSDARVAIHWGLSGRADNFASKPFALLVLPILSIIIGIFLATRSQGAPAAPSLFAFAVLLGAHALIVFSAVK